MICPKCQTENPEGVKFCGECGQSLQIELACPECGHVSPSDVKFCHECGHSLTEQAPTPSPIPTSFAGGRYQVKRFLGEGGMKKVYLAHDSRLDRDVAFSLIKVERLDNTSRGRVSHEVQAMGRLGAHSNIVTIFDVGEHEGQPYMVIEMMTGGDVERLIHEAPEHRLSIEQAINIAKSVCQGIEFAHSKGIIHRDLKPGNVWLSSEGLAKIGDFGLALPLDVSRLTEQGKMVGSYHYMAPEQATGGEITVRSDLYALGAMFYEMVTGLPPFLGDNANTIIAQHINTPPVSPTWHRDNLPPSLDVLILQLLEKNPNKRPVSAADVLHTLESIETGTVGETASRVAPAVPTSPLYRSVFVGREAELKLLQSAFNTTMSGNGLVVMVVGEPGIGKTALWEQLSAYVAIRGGKTVVGHCYEEGSLKLPYLAFIEVIRSYVLTSDLSELRKELGTGAADVARIVSEVRERLRLKPRPPVNPEEDRYRLFQAVTGFLTNAATTRPLLVVLEDLHNADKDTLEMLIHVARNISGTRLLIIGTYRDVEVDRMHPLSAALAELRRIATFDRVLLHGLSISEVRRMLENIAGQPVPQGLTEAVHHQTEGNPLFVQEVLRYLIEAGIISREKGRWLSTRETPLEMSIPEGLRDVIGKRLSRLSEECNRVLSVAAIIGREFPLDILHRVAGVPDNEVFAALEEAKVLAIIEEHTSVGAAVSYRFTHAFIRQTLYEEIIAPRRIRLHQQVGQALEEVYTKRLEEHATELAEHFAHSSDPADLAKSVSYGEMAAQRAASVYAYGEEARLLEQTLKVQEVLDPDDKAKRCDLLLAASEALVYEGEPRRALDAELPEAFALAEAIGDRSRIVNVCRLAADALLHYESGAALATTEAAEWAERADRYADPDTVERSQADTLLGVVKCVMGRSGEGVSLLSRAVDMARCLGDRRTFGWSATLWLWQVSAPEHAEESLRLAEELMSIYDNHIGLANADAAHFVIAVFLSHGRRQRAEDVYLELKALAERTGRPDLVLESMAICAAISTMDGCLEAAIDMTDRVAERGEELGIPRFAAILAGLVGLRPRLYLSNAHDSLQRALELTLDDPYKLVCAAHLGWDAEVAEVLEQQVLARPGIGSATDQTPTIIDLAYLEAAVLVGHREATQPLLQRLASISTNTVGWEYAACIGRHLGSAAVLLDRPEEAHQLYHDALVTATDMRFRPEIALTRLQLAELQVEHYPDEKSEALEHLDFVITEFGEMKMQPSLERALKCKESTGH